jgi:ArsR family transcriptional regulator
MLDPDLVLDVIGNSTRRKILTTLSKEPMYFNQLSKQIGVGQQAILRHVRSLEESGLISSYVEKSNLAAPDRRYYKLKSEFSLTISMSQDAFGIQNSSITESRCNESKKFYKQFDSTPNDTSDALVHMQSSLVDIDDEISSLEFRLNDLRALRQLILRQLHQVGRETFGGYLERRVLYNIVEEGGRIHEEKGKQKGNERIARGKKSGRRTVQEIANSLNENECLIKESIAKIRRKLDGNTAEMLLGNIP